MKKLVLTALLSYFSLTTSFANHKPKVDFQSSFCQENRMACAKGAEYCSAHKCDMTVEAFCYSHRSVCKL